MEALKNRKTAAIVCIIAVLISLVISASMAGTRTERLFYEGVKFDGYTHTPIYTALSDRAKYANNLASILTNCPGCEAAADKLREARRGLIDAYDAKDISDMYMADCALTEAADDIAELIMTAGLDTDDLNDAQSCLDSMSGAEKAIAQSGYNEEVDGLRGFNLNNMLYTLLSALPFVDAPERFG